jgi:sorbitol-specific phosphotransferase system component IIBC
MGSMGKTQQSTPPTPESSLTPFEQAVQLKKMDMEMEMKRMQNDMDMKKMDMEVEMKKKDKDMVMQIIAVLGFVTGVFIFSISIKDGLLGNRVNSFLAWLQAGLTNNKLFLKAWIGASIAEKVSLLFNRIWNFVFLKKSLPATKLF